MRTITLEFLRHGPPNNQLLSPLTRYLALCGNRPGVTVEVPFEHAKLLLKLQSLRYKSGDRLREMQIDDTADMLSGVLEQVPGLISELGNSKKADTDITHLRLILSANELALLPFEMANAPKGVPGAGQPLSLQTDNPLCLTREVRRIKDTAFEWPRKPKILFAFASPVGVAPVPHKSHLLALRYCIKPWVYYYADHDEMEDQVGRHLKVLPNASMESISRECESGEYTHVHILAHGIEYEKGADKRFGLALHSARKSGQRDNVSGDRLVSALRPREDKGRKNLVRPAVVTIASCDGGNVGTVYGAGASIAHALHQAGIPLVVASQFPLSFAGSIHMVETLYAGFFAGDDPRLNLDALRRKLKSQLKHTHDWASIVAYSSLPDNFEEQLSSMRISRGGWKIRSALSHADRYTRRISDFYSKESDTPPRENELQEKLSGALDRLHEGMKQLRSLLKDAKAEEGEILGLLASAEKREAEIRSRRFQRDAQVDEFENEKTKNRIKASLKRSLDYYDRVFETDRTGSWALVQQLWLKFLLRETLHVEVWQTARVLSLKDIDTCGILNPQSIAWARSNLIELDVIALLDPELREALECEENPDFSKHSNNLNLDDKFKERAVKETHSLLKLHARFGVDLHSLRRQLLRYVEVFSETRRIPDDAADLAREILEMLK